MLGIAAGSANKPCNFSYIEGSGLLNVIIPDDEGAPSKALLATLEGPSGKGEYRLEYASEGELSREESLIGGATEYENWEVVQDGSLCFLRYRDPTSSSRWIATREDSEDSAETWHVWWISPNAANMEDFAEYVIVDLQLVSAE